MPGAPDQQYAGNQGGQGPQGAYMNQQNQQQLNMMGQGGQPGQGMMPQQQHPGLYQQQANGGVTNGGPGGNQMLPMGYMHEPGQYMMGPGQAGSGQIPPVDSGVPNLGGGMGENQGQMQNMVGGGQGQQPYGGENNYCNDDDNSDNEAGGKGKRRSKNDVEGRDFKCNFCPKTYLSYPALYTHIKQKHSKGPDGEIRAPPTSGRGRGRPRKNVSKNLRAIYCSLLTIYRICIALPSNRPSKGGLLPVRREERQNCGSSSVVSRPF